MSSQPSRLPGQPSAGSAPNSASGHARVAQLQSGSDEPCDLSESREPIMPPTTSDSVREGAPVVGVAPVVGMAPVKGIAPVAGMAPVIGVALVVGVALPWLGGVFRAVLLKRSSEAWPTFLTASKNQSRSRDSVTTPLGVERKLAEIRESVRDRRSRKVWLAVLQLLRQVALVVVEERRDERPLTPPDKGKPAKLIRNDIFCHFRGFRSTETEFVDGVAGGLLQAHQLSRESATVHCVTPPPS